MVERSTQGYGPMRQAGYNERLSPTLTFALARSLTVYQYGDAATHRGLPPSDLGAPLIDRQGRRLDRNTARIMSGR